MGDELTEFRSGVRYERARIVGGVRYILDHGGGTNEIRDFLDNLEHRPSVASQLRLMTILDDVDDLVGRMAVALDAHQRYVPGGIVTVDTEDERVDFDFRNGDRRVQFSVLSDGAVGAEAFERGVSVQVRGFGVVDDFDDLVVPIRSYVTWLAGHGDLDT